MCLTVLWGWCLKSYHTAPTQVLNLIGFELSSVVIISRLTAQRMKFSMKHVLLFPAGFVTFTEEILGGKFHFLQ